jgi:hypothetical protein
VQWTQVGALGAFVTGSPANSVRDAVADTPHRQARFHQWLAELGNALLAPQGIAPPWRTIEHELPSIAEQQAAVRRFPLPM